MIIKDFWRGGMSENTHTGVKRMGTGTLSRWGDCLGSR